MGISIGNFCGSNGNGEEANGVVLISPSPTKKTLLSQVKKEKEMVVVVKQ